MFSINYANQKGVQRGNVTPICRTCKFKMITTEIKWKTLLPLASQCKGEAGLQQNNIAYVYEL